MTEITPPFAAGFLADILRGTSKLTPQGAPALIIHDRDDADVSHAHGSEIAQSWPGAQLMTTTGLGHRVLVRDPEVTPRTIGFLSERPVS